MCRYPNEGLLNTEDDWAALHIENHPPDLVLFLEEVLGRGVQLLQTVVHVISISL